LDNSKAALLRNLPSVDGLLTSPGADSLLRQYGRAATTAAIRDVLQDARRHVLAGGAVTPAPGEVLSQASRRLADGARSSLRPVFNLTGTVLHTNLGRALLAEVAIEAARAAMADAVPLEFDLATGKRGERDDHIRDLLCELTGAEDATIVNNNAAAVLIALNTLASGREAIVSRGELIEIGGAFRMPEIMARAGATLVEVGTTNRTHAKDYESAITPATGVLLKVHTSNYRIMGFTKEVEAPELARIGAEANVPVMHDLGSGSLIDLSEFGLRREPTVREAVADGAGLVTFSGDKLLGGPQCGFIVGKRELVTAINRNPMKRALRVDKIRLAAIEATLRLYRDPNRLAEQLPTLHLLARPQADIAAQAARVHPVLSRALAPDFEVAPCECQSLVGSGALPLDTVASAGLAIRAHAGGGPLTVLAAKFRALSRPIIGRIEDDALVLDLRCLTDEAAFLSELETFNRDASSDAR
jgi:L-seryl-tRNA(Ser) seleniumtransferase